MSNAWTWPPAVSAAIDPSAIVGSELWAPPSPPHALDDEFSSATLSSAWTSYRTNNPPTGALVPMSFNTTTPINVFSVPPRDTCRVSTTRRRSWLQCQPGGGSAGGAFLADYHLIKPIGTLATDQAFYTRLAAAYLGNTIDTSLNCFGIWLFGTNAGLPDIANGLKIFLFLNGNAAYSANFVRIAGGVETNVIVFGGRSFVNSLLLDSILGLQKVGSNYYPFIGTTEGAFVMAPSAAPPTPLGFVGLYWRGRIDEPEGRAVYSFDFLRSFNGVALPL